MIQITESQEKILTIMSHCTPNSVDMLNRAAETDPPAMITERNFRNAEMDDMLSAGLLTEVVDDAFADAEKSCGHKLRRLKLSTLGRAMLAAKGVAN